MGYNTTFKGKFEFTRTRDVNAETLEHLIFHLLGKDIRENPDFSEYYGLFNFVDLALEPDWSGLKHNGAEKTGNMVEIVNFVIKEMKKKNPFFGLKGSIRAQGDEVGDVYEIYIDDDGLAHRRNLLDTASTKTVECPKCNHCFKVKV